MTKEEAKEYLDNYRKMYADLAPERFLEALDIMLNEPSLPSDMDEATQKIEDYYDGGEEEKPKTQTIKLNDAKRFCLGLSTLAKECKMESIDYTMLGIKTLHFADGSSIGGLRAYIDAGLITKI